MNLVIFRGDAVETLTQDIDDEMVDFGYITSLKMVSAGSTATLGVSTVTGYVRKIVLTNDGLDILKHQLLLLQQHLQVEQMQPLLQSLHQ